VDVFRHLD